MAILKDSVIIPLNRPLFIPKDGKLTVDDLIIESSDRYLLIEKPEHFIVKNDDCCRSIKVTIKTKE